MIGRTGLSTGAPAAKLNTKVRPHPVIVHCRIVSERGVRAHAGPTDLHLESDLPGMRRPAILRDQVRREGY